MRMLREIVQTLIGIGLFVAVFMGVASCMGRSTGWW